VGVVYGGNGMLIGIQLVGVTVTIAWAAFNTCIIMLLFIALDRFKYIQFQLGVSAQVEEIGLDMAQIV
jgi:ammonia channel protein AmtB